MNENLEEKNPFSNNFDSLLMDFKNNKINSLIVWGALGSPKTHYLFKELKKIKIPYIELINKTFEGIDKEIQSNDSESVVNLVQNHSESLTVKQIETLIKKLPRNKKLIVVYNFTVEMPHFSDDMNTTYFTNKRI